MLLYLPLNLSNYHLSYGIYIITSYYFFIYFLHILCLLYLALVLLCYIILHKLYNVYITLVILVQYNNNLEFKIAIKLAYIANIINVLIGKVFNSCEIVLHATYKKLVAICLSIPESTLDEYWRKYLISSTSGKND